MAKSTLQQLFDGEIFPSENISPSSSKYNEYKKALDEEITCLMNTLSGDDRDRFQKLNDLYCKTESIYTYECFAHGFRLAVSLMVESVNNRDKPCWK